jgi:endonuclease/exonuclease/phosphatase family metal-dependent hydrolase
MFWQPIDTAPHEGRVLLAVYGPTSWSYYVASAHLHAGQSPRQRELALRYARAWMPYPDEPSEALRSGD